MEPTIINDTEAEEFQLRAGDEVLSLLAYRHGEGMIALTHAETADGHGGQGYAAQVTQHAIAYAQEQGLGVLPMCSYVRHYMLDRPELLAMVPVKYLDPLGLSAAAAAAQRASGPGGAHTASNAGAGRPD